MAILLLLNHRRRSLTYSRQLTRSVGLRDVAMMAVSSTLRASSTWCKGVGMLTYRLKRTGEIKPPCATPARMPRRDDVAVWKDASNVRPRKYDEMVWTR